MSCTHMNLSLSEILKAFLHTDCFSSFIHLRPSSLWVDMAFFFFYQILIWSFMALQTEEAVERTVLIVSAIEFPLHEVEYWVRRGKNILQSGRAL